MARQEMRLATNFKWEAGTYIEGTISDYKDTGLYDERNSCISVNTDYSNMEWYFNYLEMIATIVGQYPQNRAAYMFQLGYIPVIALPTCCISMEVPMTTILDRIRLPYVKTSQFVFDNSYKTDLPGMDVWVSKLDIEKHFRMSLRDIRAVEVARLIFNV